MPIPTSNEEWKIHALNLHGGFFEQKIASIINDYNPKKLFFINSEYPVEVSGEESRLDVLGFIPNSMSDDKKSGIFLPIECKKHNPELIDWIFYPTIQNQLYGNDYSHCFFLKSFPTGGANIYRTKIELSGIRFPEMTISGDCREVRGTYRDVSNGIKTKTSNSSINEAAYQVTLATHSIIKEHVRLTDQFNNVNKSPANLVYFYIPIIVTTANLFLLDYKLSDINANLGEIPLNKTKLMQLNCLLYEYPVPPHLQIENEIDTNIKLPTYNNIHSYDFAVRRNILVVNSAHIEETLKRLISLQFTIFN